MSSSTRSQEHWLQLDEIAVPCGTPARGRLRPPSSKSVSHRMMNLTMLSGTAARIKHLLAAQDLDLFRQAFASCGWTVSGTPADLELKPPGSRVEAASPAEVFCGNAGTMFRFMVAARAQCAGSTVIDGTARLRERPIGPLVDALRQLGADIEFLGNEGCAPLKVRGGSLRPGRTTLDAGESSQYLSAVLMACSFLDEPSEVAVSRLVSSPYVAVTLAAMERFGLALPERAEAAQGDSVWRVLPAPAAQSNRATRTLEIEADYSAAAYPAAAAMISGGEVAIEGLDAESVQGDRKFLQVLEHAGGEMRFDQGVLHCGGRPTRALDVDLGDMPDQVPTLAAVAAFCPGVSRIRNVAHLRIKESDRLAAVALEWRNLGINVSETSDGLTIEGRPEWLQHAVDLEPRRVATYDDHRIAMSAALVGLRRPLVIKDPSVVAKSYPGFWVDLFDLLS